MRRALGVLLLVVFSLPLIAPVFTSAPDESALPACCRRDGKHHCMMAGMMANVPSSYRTVSEKCPFAPFGGFALMLPHAFAVHAAPRSVAHTAGTTAPVRDAEAGYRISFHRARQKRGPPSLLSL
jgi:hypothetical protein